MKKVKLSFIRDVIRSYLQYFFMLFGITILVKHFLFKEGLGHAEIVDNLFTSMLTAILFVIFFPSPLNGKQMEVKGPFTR